MKAVKVYNGLHAKCTRTLSTSSYLQQSCFKPKLEQAGLRNVTQAALRADNMSCNVMQTHWRGRSPTASSAARFILDLQC